MSSRWMALAMGALLASQEANAACVIHGARPTVPLPTMPSGQEFSFIASPDCETLRFTIRGTTVSKTPRSGEQVGPGPKTYKVKLTESEWDGVVAELGPTLTWVVTGRTSAGVTTRTVTTNELKRNEQITMDLSMADAKLAGEVADDQAGRSVAVAGDVNGDGLSDLLIGAPFNEEGGTWAGAAYLVLGPVSGTLDLSLAAAKLVGGNAFIRAGDSVSGAGDVDGDGHDDLLVGVSPWSFAIGTPSLVLGPVTGTLDLSAADANFVGEEDGDFDDDFVESAWDAGDLNGDGRGDLLVGAPGNDEGGEYAGAAYVLLGPVTGTVDLAFADAKLVGEEEHEFAGRVVSDAGDVDADGHDDVLVGATAGRGTVYVVRGPVSGTLDLSLADAKLVDDPWSDVSVSGAGDVDGDGHDDVLIGASRSPNYVGGAYLVLGPVTGTFDLSHADATLVGERRNDETGKSVSGAGDVDADGHDDVLVGSHFNDQEGGNAGAAYLVLGPVTGTLDLSRADVKFVGEEADDWAGESVAGVDDLNADGHGDVLVGAPFENDDAGAAYVIYGGGL